MQAGTVGFSSYLCPMEHRFQAHIETHFPEMPGQPFLLACSGGLDSTVLSHLLRDMGLRFEIAHCNFQLRGAESRLDAEFVRNLGATLEIPVHINSFDTLSYAASKHLSIQQAARQLRYAWFKEICRERGLPFVVTAHHADDVVETFLINLIRGGGLDGLTGIPPRANGIRRPLLPFAHTELTAYAAEKGLRWREDASNQEEKYLRNRLRHRVIPELKKADSRFMQNFQKTLGFLQGSRALVAQHIDALRKTLFIPEGPLYRIPIDPLSGLHPRQPHLYELFHPYGFTDWEALDRLLTASPGKVLVSPSHELLRDRTELLLRARVERKSGTYTIDLEDPAPQGPLGLRLELVEKMGQTGPRVLYIDRETLMHGLQLRKWRKGDYFYPLGMQGRQKVSKYFKDHKLSRFEKEAQWLLCSGDEIVWIAGHRADDRFRVREGTKQILKITCTT